MIIQQRSLQCFSLSGVSPSGRGVYIKSNLKKKSAGRTVRKAQIHLFHEYKKDSLLIIQTRVEIKLKESLTDKW